MKTGEGEKGETSIRLAFCSKSMFRPAALVTTEMLLSVAA